MVLIFDRDGPTRHAMRWLLRTAGFDTLLAADLPEAAEIARRCSSLELLVLSSPMDCDVPALKAADALRAIAAGRLKTVLILDSLWSVPEQLRADPLVRLTRKPIGPEALIAALTELHSYKTDHQIKRDRPRTVT